LLQKRFRILLDWLGSTGLLFFVLVSLFLALGWMPAPGVSRFIVAVGAFVSGVWLLFRLLRRAATQVIWRLRNRLLVTYMFIGLVPILLVAGLALLGGYLLVEQLAVFLVTSSLQRRIDSFATITDSVVHTDQASRPPVMERTIDLFYRQRYPEIEILLRESGREIRYPEGTTMPAPLNGWKPNSGVVVRGGRFYIWSYAKTPSGDVTVAAPLDSSFLAGLVPKLGLVDVGQTSSPRPGAAMEEERGIAATRSLPPARSRFDPEVIWYATLPADDWSHPGQPGQPLFIAVRSRVSAVLGAVFNSQDDRFQSLLIFSLTAGLAIFVAVEIISLMVGFGMTRTITLAVHRLYEGTQRVIQGDFAHRIEVHGTDQLAELGQSFNRMTENTQRLLLVAKEKERLEADIEIAREVQSQLFPREVPRLPTLRVRAVCQPARLVSGDYYDYEMVGDEQVALAIADVAGKGISAALLMAAIQSSLRAQLQNVMDLVPAGGGGENRFEAVSTSHVVSNLNVQLYATTAPEKYATFCFGIYDQPSSTFRYTNAGHLPPMLVRGGHVEMFEVNGTVVGAFPFSRYDESQVTLDPGDLVVFYTDGVTEPENEYGEMFGEERLMELLSRHGHRDEDEIIRMVLDAVKQWTATEELQDDMTLLLARRL
jgi:sigma-B regulation protein RsbU (phosphoserine phosphatase)